MTIPPAQPEDHKPWVAIQRNPKSGAGLQAKPILNLISEFRRRNLQPRLFSVREELDRQVNDPVQRQTLKGIVAAGGDGTLLDVMNRHPNIPIAILPLGTENLCAKYLGMKRDGKQIAQVVAEGETVRFDVGRLGTQRFMVMASVGFDAAVIHEVHAKRSGHVTRWTYINPILHCLTKFTYPQLRVFVDDSKEPVVGSLVVIANLPSYALGLKVAADARGDDGLLDIRVMQRGSSLNMFRYLGLIYYRWHERVRDVVKLKAKRIRIESEVPAPIQVDGDPAGFTPAEINIETNVGELFVPRGHQF